MGQKNKYKEYPFQSGSSGHSSSKSDFDLDEYIRRKSRESDDVQYQPTTIDKTEESTFKNAVLFFLVFAAAFLWVNDWSVSQTWNSVFGNEDPVAEVATNVPSIDNPEAPPAPGVENSSGFVEFLTQANEAGLDEYYSNIALQSMYQADVTIEYLQNLTDAGFQDFSYPAVIGFFNGDITTEYLGQLQDSGFLEQFSYPAIIAFYNSDITMEYLEELQQAGVLNDFSYPAIISFYGAGVSAEYLNEMNGFGYLSEFSYPAIVAFYSSEVTPEYLNQLAQNDLLEGMSYPDIVSAFNADN